MDLADDVERREIVQLLDFDSPSLRTQLHDRFRRHGAVDYAREVAERYARQAREALNGLPASSALDALLRVTEFVVDRSG